MKTPTRFRQERILEEVKEALNEQFSSYSFNDMICDALGDKYSEDEIDWAQKHITYTAMWEPTTKQ